MAVELQEESGGKILVIRANGKLNKGDYERFVPEVDRLIRQHGKIGVLFEMHDFHGWTAGALWEDLRFDFRHFRDIDRLALVGETKWQEWMSTFCHPFTTAKIRVFGPGDTEQARAWLDESNRAETAPEGHPTASRP
jgi:hypothetical protein